MHTAGDALTKTLAKSQKVTFWSKKNCFECFFFLLTAGDALMGEKWYWVVKVNVTGNGATIFCEIFG